MFWRKNQDTKKLFVHETVDRRNSYRAHPAENKPVYITIEEMEVFSATTISAGGISFKHRLVEGDLYNASFRLPGSDIPTSLKLEAIKIDQRGICHCRFNDISEGATESIHLYVLERQKEKIKVKRTGYT